MASDGTAPDGRRQPEYDLPQVVSVSARRAILEPPKRRNFRSLLPAVESTIEFLVETDGPIPIRALAPTLFVGDVPVTEVRPIDETHYSFVALRPQDLEGGQPITLGWSGATAREHPMSGQRFELPR